MVVVFTLGDAIVVLEEEEEILDVDAVTFARADN
jgi:hypothetical protein